MKPSAKCRANRSRRTSCDDSAPSTARGLYDSVPSATCGNTLEDMLRKEKAERYLNGPTAQHPDMPISSTYLTKALEEVAAGRGFEDDSDVNYDIGKSISEASSNVTITPRDKETPRTMLQGGGKFADSSSSCGDGDNLLGNLEPQLADQHSLSAMLSRVLARGYAARGQSGEDVTPLSTSMLLSARGQALEVIEENRVALDHAGHDLRLYSSERSDVDVQDCGFPDIMEEGEVEPPIEPSSPMSPTSPISPPAPSTSDLLRRTQETVALLSSRNAYSATATSPLSTTSTVPSTPKADPLGRTKETIALLSARKAGAPVSSFLSMNLAPPAPATKTEREKAWHTERSHHQKLQKAHTASTITTLGPEDTVIYHAETRTLRTVAVLPTNTNTEEPAPEPSADVKEDGLTLMQRHACSTPATARRASAPDVGQGSPLSNHDFHFNEYFKQSGSADEPPSTPACESPLVNTRKVLEMLSARHAGSLCGQSNP